jgi:hypothetical protein
MPLKNGREFTLGAYLKMRRRRMTNHNQIRVRQQVQKLKACNFFIHDCCFTFLRTSSACRRQSLWRRTAEAHSKKPTFATAFTYRVASIGRMESLYSHPFETKKSATVENFPSTRDSRSFKVT